MIKEGFHHYAHGKLLLSGEYFVLDGAEALAVPTIPGQHFNAYKVGHKQSSVHWKSLNIDKRCWFEGKFLLDGTFYPSYLSDEETGRRILEFLNAAVVAMPEKMTGYATDIVTSLEFNRAWGLGSSSTLVSSFAKWLNMDPFRLLKDTFGGSGYDVACADATGPILFCNRPAQPEIISVELNWNFKEHLLFAYLGNKQDSREGIRHYEAQPSNHAVVARISNLARDMINASDIGSFMEIMNEHEAIVAETLGLQRVKSMYFNDFEGSIKSLGAWGGDFILAAGTGPREDIEGYFLSKGLDPVFTWDAMILEN